MVNCKELFTDMLINFTEYRINESNKQNNIE